MSFLRTRSDSQGILQFSQAQRLFINLLNKQNQFWKQRAKMFWYKGGDNNTKFFHNAVKQRKRNNTIQRLKDDAGNWITQGPELNALVRDYFINIFSSATGDLNPVISCINPKITSTQNHRLLMKFSSSEINKALFGMHLDKSPGFDGFNPGFFQSYWDILGESIVHFCNEFLKTGKLPKGLNTTQIVLIPKKTNSRNYGRSQTYSTLYSCLQNPCIGHY